MAPKKDLMSDIAHLLEKADMQIKNAGKEKKRRTPCKDCGATPVIYRGLCQGCLDILKANKEAAKVGKRWVSTNGYEYIYIEGMIPVLYHRFRMEQLIGRPLLSHEQVGHKNGLKADNVDSNLILVTKAGFDLSTLQCPHCDHLYIEFKASTAS